MSVPTDCPQRDERLGWLADAAVSAQEALRFFDGAAFYAGFARTIADDQDPRDGSVPDFTPDCDEEDGDPLTVCNRSYARPADPAWGSAAVLIPWFAFAASGDAALLAASYPSMLAYVNALLATANATGGVLRTGSLGDWYAVLKCDTPLVSSFHLVWNLDLVAAAAQALADAPNAQRLASAAAAARAAYNAAFYRPAARAYGDTGTQGMQAANAMPLFGGIANASLWGPVAETLANVVAAGEPLPNGTRLYAGHVTTGVTGTKVLLETLARLGRNDLALCVATQRDFPSWGFMAANNATTLWEHWDLELGAEDCSLNHIMFGSVGHWLFGAVAGLESGDRGNETLAVAYELARVDPRIANASLTYAGAKVESPRGALVAWWARTPQQDGFSLELRVPPNTPAVVYVPKLDASRPDCATGLNVSGTADWALEGDTGAECVLFVADGGGVLRVNHGRAVTAVCAAANLSWSSGNWKLLVECPARALVSAVDFASLGQPEGSCGFFAAHRCHWAGSRSAVERACLGQPACILSAADFGVDPNCSAVPPEQQWLAVQVQCAESPSA
jgi:alpha-L-rhamnosidase